MPNDVSMKGIIKNIKNLKSTIFSLNLQPKFPYNYKKIIY